MCAFYSAKLNPAQQNYLVHEIEMLAGVECMLRHRDILQGLKFTWITDHKGLVHLYNQKTLSGRQACWMEKLGEFDFEVQYVLGAENVLADALSRLWSNESPGMVHGCGVYTYHDVIDNNSIETHGISMPVLVGVEASCLMLEGIHLNLNAMSLCTGCQLSVWARGLDNKIVPGKLESRVNSVSSHRPWKEGEGAKQNIPKPKSKPKPKSYPMSKVKQMAVKTFEPESTQDNENVQEGTKLVEAISPLAIVN